MNQVKLVVQDLINKLTTEILKQYILEFRKIQEDITMSSTLFKIKCEKGHKGNALIWDGQTIQNYLEHKKCNSCGSLLHQL